MWKVTFWFWSLTKIMKTGKCYVFSKVQQVEIFVRFPCLLFPFFLHVGFFFLWFIFCYLIFVCAEVHWFHKSCSIDFLKVARNLLKEIFYIDFMSLTFYTSLNISMLLQGMVLNFSWMGKEGGEHRLVWDRLRVFCGVLHTLTLKKSLR